MLKNHARVSQFIHGNLFPRYFAQINDYCIQSRLEFDNLYRFYLGQKTFFNWQIPQIKTEEVDENNAKTNVAKVKVEDVENYVTEANTAVEKVKKNKKEKTTVDKEQQQQQQEKN